jgi:hypothetical protein
MVASRSLFGQIGIALLAFERQARRPHVVDGRVSGRNDRIMSWAMMSWPSERALTVPGRQFAKFQPCADDKDTGPRCRASCPVAIDAADLGRQIETGAVIAHSAASWRWSTSFTAGSAATAAAAAV